MWDNMLEWFNNHAAFSEILGLIGQTLFFLGWGVQWYVQTKLRRNIVPVQFWILRFVGAGLLLASCISHEAWSVSIGFVTGLIFYGYNIAIFKKLSVDPVPPPAK